MKKSVLIFLTSLCLGLTLAGCGQKNADDANTTSRQSQSQSVDASANTSSMPDCCAKKDGSKAPDCCGDPSAKEKPACCSGKHKPHANTASYIIDTKGETEVKAVSQMAVGAHYNGVLNQYQISVDLKNSDAQALTQLKFKITLKDASGNEIGSLEKTSSHQVQPDEQSPFVFQLTPAEAHAEGKTVKTIEVTLLEAQSAPKADIHFADADLQRKDVSDKTENQRITFTGSLQNITEHEAKNVRVYLTLIKDTKDIGGYRSELIPSIGANQSVTFKCQDIPADLTYDTVRLTPVVNDQE